MQICKTTCLKSCGIYCSFQKVSSHTRKLVQQCSICIRDVVLRCLEVPVNYAWDHETSDNYLVKGRTMAGPYKAIREKMDFEYHGCYGLKRQQLQDEIIERILGSSGAGSVGTADPHPWIVFYSRIIFRWQILGCIVDAWAGPLAFGPSENRPRFDSNSTTRVVGLLEARWARSSCDDSARSWHLCSHRPVGSSATRPSHPRGWVIADSWMNSNAA